MRLKLKIVALVLIVTVLFSSMNTRKAEADWPILSYIAIRVTVIVVAAAIVWAIKPDPPITMRIEGTWKLRDGNEGTGKLKKFAQSPETIEVPAEFPGSPLPPGYTMAESILFEARPDEVVELQYTALDYEANVNDPGFAGVQVEFAVDRTGTFGFERPEDELGTPTVTIPIEIEDLVVSTVDVPGTTGSSSYELKIDSPQLGVVFESSVYVPQGGMPIITGDIPASAFSVSPGHAELADYSDSVSVLASPGLSEIDFTVTSDIEGQGALLGVGGIAELPDVAGTAPAASGSSGPGAGVLPGAIAGAVAAGGVALGGAAWYARRRLLR